SPAVPARLSTPPVPPRPPPTSTLFPYTPLFRSFPGWTVEVDGAPAAPVVANYLLRAVRVGPGHHRVRWRFQPPGVRALIDGYLRSEEHTSELQSREKLVCRLLLEKKKANLERAG